jgi:choline dehydrogenase-like flavoprotein
VASRVLDGDDGKARGVEYFDRVTGERHEVRARVVVVAASCIDSTRILLNSKSARYPNGIGNSADVIGRYLCEQIRFHLTGFVPDLMGTATRNDDGIGGAHIYMPLGMRGIGRRRVVETDARFREGIQSWGKEALPGAGGHAPLWRGSTAAI